MNFRAAIVWIAFVGLLACGKESADTDAAAAFTARSHLRSLCWIAVEPLRYAPAFIDGGRILPGLVQRFGPTLKTKREERPNLHDPDKMNQHNTYDFEHMSFETLYVPHLEKELLTGAHYRDLDAADSFPVRPLDSPGDLNVHLGKANRIDADGRYHYSVSYCAGHGFSEVGAELDFQFQAGQTFLKIRYDYD